MTIAREARSSGVVVLVLGLLIATGCAAPAAAAGGGSVGLRYGRADATGDLFDGSGDLGGCNLVGLQLGLGLLPMIELEFAGEYVSEAFSFKEGLFEGVEAAGKGDYEDLTLYVTGKANLITLMILPIKGYIGGGANVHYVDLTVKDVVEEGAGGGASGDLEEAIRKVTGKTTEVGWHAVAGLKLAFSGLPVSVFVEGRYVDPFKRTEGVPTAKSVYAGISLNL